MNTIKFNDVEFNVMSYNKSTTFNGDRITSNAYCDIVPTDIAALHELGDDLISTIQIYHDGELIYSITDQEGHITNINEYLNGDHMSANVTLVFGEVNVEPAMA